METHIDAHTHAHDLNSQKHRGKKIKASIKYIHMNEFILHFCGTGKKTDT